MNISYSRVGAYMSCPYSHYLNYELGVYPKAPQRPLYFGTDFHRLLECRNDPEKLHQALSDISDAYYAMPANWQSELGSDYIEGLCNIFADYCDVYRNARMPAITEHEFEIPMFEHKSEPYVFKGKIDELYKLKKNGVKYLKVGEHKTFNRRPDHNTLIMNNQKNLYAKAVQFLWGSLPRSVIWDYVHSTPAPYPVWLEKQKRFSAAKSTTITPYSWVRACKEYGVTDPDIIAKAEEYRGNVPAYFFRVEQQYDQRAVDETWDGFVYQARLIAKHGKTNKTKNMTRNCSYCSYRDICYTQLTGGNLSYLIEQKYEVKPRSDIVNEERRAVDGICEKV